MPHIITSLCLRDGACIKVCPARCIVAGKPMAEWPWMYIDPDECTDCDTCVSACPCDAIFVDEDVPDSYIAKAGQRLNAPSNKALRVRATERLEIKNRGKVIVLDRTVTLDAGEIVNLRDDVPDNARFFKEGPGYKAREM